MASTNPNKRNYSTMANDSNSQHIQNKDGKQSCSTCSICNLSFSSLATLNQHLGTKFHKKNQDHWNQKCGIFVRGFDQTTAENDLKTYFSQFGKVVRTHLGRGFLILDFTEPDCVEKVLSRSHRLRGRILFVKRKEPRVSSLDLNKSGIDKEEHTKLLSTLKNMNNLNQEADFLQSTLQPNLDVMLPKYNTICRDLHTIISVYFPCVEIHPFGSTVTGLCFKDSDVDIYIANVKLPVDDEVGLLREIKTLLVKSGTFTRSIVIPSAKIPIVKCIHYSTRIKCDLNINHMLGVYNSKLIYYYIRLFPSVKRCMVVLKYWGKTHKITGQNPLLSNYALTILFISFLQHIYSFPSVRSLQTNYFELNSQEFWNGHFNQNYRFVSRSVPNSVCEILAKFFQYYIDFNYKDNIVCPYLGVPVNKSHLEVLDEFYLYRRYIMDESNPRFKVNSFMCIQDPFEHSRNITGSINLSTMEKFVSFCKLGASLCSQDKNNNLLYRLLSEVPAQKPSFALKQNLTTKKKRGLNSSKMINSNSSDSLKTPEVVTNEEERPHSCETSETITIKEECLNSFKTPEVKTISEENMDNLKPQEKNTSEEGSLIETITIEEESLNGSETFDLIDDSKYLEETVDTSKSSEIIAIIKEDSDSLTAPKTITVKECSRNVSELILHNAILLKTANNIWFKDMTEFILMTFRDILGISVVEKVVENGSKIKRIKKEGQLDVHDTTNLKIFHCDARINLWDHREKTAKKLNVIDKAATLLERETIVTRELRRTLEEGEKSIMTFKIILRNENGEMKVRIKRLKSFKNEFKSFSAFFRRWFPAWCEFHQIDLYHAGKSDRVTIDLTENLVESDE